MPRKEQNELDCSETGVSMNNC